MLGPSFLWGIHALKPGIGKLPGVCDFELCIVTHGRVKDPSCVALCSQCCPAQTAFLFLFFLFKNSVKALVQIFAFNVQLALQEEGLIASDTDKDIVDIHIGTD